MLLVYGFLPALHSYTKFQNVSVFFPYTLLPTFLMATSTKECRPERPPPPRKAQSVPLKLNQQITISTSVPPLQPHLIRYALIYLLCHNDILL